MTGGSIAVLGVLRQLADLQLHHLRIDTTVAQIRVALSPLTQLTRLSIEFGAVSHHLEGGIMEGLPEAVYGLTVLQELRFGGLEFCFGRRFPPALANLRRLEHLELRGCAQHDDVGVHSDRQATLADLPALRTAVLRLRLQDGPLPLLPPPGGPAVSGLRSLTLTVGSWAETPVLDMPALTELNMMGVGEHRPGDALPWLAALPVLRVRLWHDMECTKTGPIHRSSLGQQSVAQTLVHNARSIVHHLCRVESSLRLCTDPP